MIKHSVIFKLKYPEDSVEAQNFFKSAKELASISGVQNFESLRQTSKKNNYDFGFSMEFTNRILYEEYNKHPLHVNFIQEYWLPCVAEFMETDYEPMDA
ncbi:Dabb family protein [Panacibacter ginsenosidivorans]|uniref:Dabb family protein n=1 Tax=Panacibacter ginsenosidivorans TaxID=1813871 RepID=A0A5B8VEH7_9BACT|nr:Dabb family protein [Panacibacter ginsenosidivorans]QEC69830.1 Dabb family protein [Panacibacter ginsenosidivorans]